MEAKYDGKKKAKMRKFKSLLFSSTRKSVFFQKATVFGKNKLWSRNTPLLFKREIQLRNYTEIEGKKEEGKKEAPFGKKKDEDLEERYVVRHNDQLVVKKADSDWIKLVERTQETFFQFWGVVGLGCAGLAGYASYKVFFGDTPYQAYNLAVGKIQKDLTVQRNLGSPIRVTLERNFMDMLTKLRYAYSREDGQTRVKMNFYIMGPKGEGFVFVQARKEDSLFSSWELVDVVVDSPQVGRIVLFENGEELPEE